MKKTITNFKMEQMLSHLKPFLCERNKIGYVAARNTRILETSLTEYFKIKHDLIEKYGEKDIDENGNDKGTISISPSSPNFTRFTEEFSQIQNIEHEVDIMTLKYDEVIGILAGKEILAIDWMLED